MSASDVIILYLGAPNVFALIFIAQMTSQTRVSAHDTSIFSINWGGGGGGPMFCINFYCTDDKSNPSFGTSYHYFINTIFV